MNTKNSDEILGKNELMITVVLYILAPFDASFLQMIATVMNFRPCKVLSNVMNCNVVVNFSYTIFDKSFKYVQNKGPTLNTRTKIDLYYVEN